MKNLGDYIFFILWSLFLLIYYINYLKKSKKLKAETLEKENIIELIDKSILESGFEIEEWASLKLKCKNLDLQYTKLIANKISNLIKVEERNFKIRKKYSNLLCDFDIENIINNKYFLGMSQQMLLDSLGQPTKMEEEILKTKHKVIYIYGNKSSGDIFTFVNNKLTSIKDR